jgi:hypothetical protein
MYPGTLDVSERTSGPWDGVYVAAYATALDGLFYGYAKLFANEPEDVWLQRPILKLGTRAFEDASDALHDAERRAKRAAAELLEPQFEGLWRTLLARAMGNAGVSEDQRPSRRGA